MNIAIKARGRRPDLSFRRRLNVVLAWDEHYHALVRREGAIKAALRLRALLLKMARLRANGAPFAKIARLSAEMDRLGRVRQVRLRKPGIALPEIDRKVAKLFDIDERMVRKCRDDPQLLPFRSPPPWEVREWEALARQETAVRQLARRLMTPERLAKGEPVRIFNGGLQVPFRAGLEWEIILGPAQPGARCSFISTLPRIPTDREARAQRAIRAFEIRIAEWKKSLE